MDTYQTLTFIAISLFFSAVFSGVEIAFVSANRLQIELQSSKGYFSGQMLARFIKKPSRFIAMTLVGNTVSLVVYGIFMAQLVDPFLVQTLPPFLNNDVSILVFQTIISTAVVLITAEFLPKSLFLLNPNWLLSFFAIPLSLLYFLMYPIIWGVVALSRFIITKILGLDYSEDKPVFGLTDLSHFIRSSLQHENVRSKLEMDTEIFTNALEFKKVKVRDCMIPRTDIVAIGIDEGIEDLRQAFVESGHSKIMVYKDSIDEIIGYCHSSELFKKPKGIESILTSIMIVPEVMLANELMVQFISEHKSVALVVDEFGGTSGIVTMEDIIEEIFGEIQDEHDVGEWTEQKIDENNYLMSARHEVDYLNDKYGWRIPEGDYDTLGGFILSVTENIPKPNEKIEISPFVFTIVSTKKTHIDLVKILILPQEEEES
ncbi:hemolysin family protein [Xanthovirga aplysinae]|uniref:hemolysin family protein n=1 Tax=Xanthovirga aplysinae TaxID=2529853 RepID=UPI0012BD4762|nr:hemolysin family protein [Xanthovirga aplysinae]MTI33439.1 HlyC/CorC family transporter [Xanthovirga aplysinae]